MNGISILNLKCVYEPLSELWIYKRAETKVGLSNITVFCFLSTFCYKIFNKMVIYYK
jgi:hypothetical protein